MEKLLFINACMRGPDLSRTLRLCRVFLEAYKAQGHAFSLEELDLAKEMLAAYDIDALIRRDALIDAGKTDDPIFDHARQLANADKILVGAPYWDLSFPAALKNYVEHVSVRNITFRNTATGVLGLCKAKKLLYITTAGGYIEDLDLGSDYFQGLCKFYGITQYESLRTEGLDIETNDPEAIMSAAEDAVRLAARQF